jgi:hypothetical protein
MRLLPWPSDSNREWATVNLVAVDHDEPLVGPAARTDED